MGIKFIDFEMFLLLVGEFDSDRVSEGGNLSFSNWAPCRLINSLEVVRRATRSD